MYGKDPRCPRGTQPAFPQALEVFDMAERYKAQLVRECNALSTVQLLVNAYGASELRAAVNAVVSEVRNAPLLPTGTLRLFIDAEAQHDQ